MARFLKYSFFAALLGLPIIVLAQQSANFRVFDGGLEANQQNSGSANFRVVGSLEPLSGSSGSANFSLVRSGSLLIEICGNGFIDIGEQCDGAQLGGATCSTLGISGSPGLVCNNSCNFNTTGCFSFGGGGSPVVVDPPAVPDFDATITDNLVVFSASFRLSGTKPANAASVTVNTNSAGVTYPSSTTWTKLVDLIIGPNLFSIRGVSSGGTSDAKSRNIIRRKMGDVSGDGVINDQDLSKLVSNWGLPIKEADLNFDGMVDDFDLSFLVASWGA